MLDLSIYCFTNKSIFTPPIYVSCLEYDYFILDRLEVLKTKLFSKANDERNSN